MHAGARRAYRDVSPPAIAANLFQPLDVEVVEPPEVTLHCVLVHFLTQHCQLLLCQLTRPLVLDALHGGHHHLRVCRAGVGAGNSASPNRQGEWRKENDCVVCDWQPRDNSGTQQPHWGQHHQVCKLRVGERSCETRAKLLQNLTRLPVFVYHNRAWLTAYRLSLVQCDNPRLLASSKSGCPRRHTVSVRMAFDVVWPMP